MTARVRRHQETGGQSGTHKHRLSADEDREHCVDWQIEAANIVEQFVGKLRSLVNISDRKRLVFPGQVCHFLENWISRGNSETVRQSQGERTEIGENAWDLPCQ